jgi:spermidine/putrescine-binding protein
MAKNYRIKVKVEIVESDQEAEVDLIQTEDGQFELVITEEQAVSIDECEQALLRTNYPAIRAAIAEHLTELSKKNC